MSEERDILRRMHELSTVGPDPAATARAVARARRSTIRGRVMRWTLAGGVAAAVVAAVVGGVISLTQQPATAAELLAQTTRATKAYRGWVHNHATYENKGEQVVHSDTESGTWADVQRIGGELNVKMYRPAEREEVTYDSRDGVVRIGELSAEFARQWKESVEQMPWTVAEAVAKIPGVTVAEARDGDLVRYDITFPKDDLGKATAAGPSFYSDRAVVWADPQTHLIRRVEGKGAEGEFRNEITYGGPAIRDVYELGVPRGAKVVDVRPTRDVGQLLERLQRRHDGAFGGDYVAVEAETPLDKDGRPDAREGTLWVHAQKGEAFANDRYLLGHEKRTGRGTVVGRWPERPAGWPTPALDAALAAVRGETPTVALVSDGTDAWSAFYTSVDDFRVEKLMGQRREGLPHLRKMYTLPGHLWPTRAGLWLYGSDAKAEVVTDPGRPGLVGLRVDQTAQGRERKRQRTLSVYWIDPARDDVPVETVQQTFAPEKAGEVELEFHTTYSGWAKTADGRWYPSAWRKVTRSNQGNNEFVQTTEHHLQVWPGRVIGPEWFAEPRKEGVGEPDAAATRPSTGR